VLDRLLAHNDLLLVALLAVCLAAFGWIDPRFLSAGNLFSILQQTAVIAVVALGMTALIIARGIDISVGSTLAVAGILGAQALGASGSAVLGLGVTLLTGLGMGMLNGLLIGLVGISPFIATLASMAFARGLALTLSHASSIPIASPAVLWAGSSTVLGLPSSIVIAGAILALWWVLLTGTVFGRWIYAIGGNRVAAHASLVPVRRVEFIGYGLVGLSAGLGAVMTFGRLGSAQPLAGIGLEFTAITAAIVGGTKLSGGEGSVLGTALGALLLGVINTGLSFLDVPQQNIYFVTAGLIVAAVLLSQPAILQQAWRDGRAAFATGATTPPSQADGPRRLELRAIGKSFPGVKALDGVTFSIGSGDVLGLAGENGAGKSTLVKCLSGVYRADEGAILVDGVALKPGSGGDVTGVSVIHQHFSLVPHLTVTENLFLGREPRNFLGLLDRRGMAASGCAVMAELGLAIDPEAELGTLTVGQKQMVEIARAVLADAWLFIMDEPTSALSNRERDHLYEIIARLLKRGAGILYISHKMEELFSLTNRIVVLRDGRFVGERSTADTTDDEVIGMMVGRDLGGVFPWVACVPGATLLSVEGLSNAGLLEEASLEIRAGEIVALTGLLGSGRSEVLRAISGLDRFTAGRVSVGGRTLRSGDLRAANASGVVLVPEDRHAEGFVGPLSIRDNLCLVRMRRDAQFGFLRRRRLGAVARDLIGSLGIRPPQPRKKTTELSGGNQQKVVIGKWLATEPKVLLLDEPTRGVDVGAKADLHRLIAGYKTRGSAILMVSSELPEVLGVADRILVMHAGRIVGELPRGVDEATVTALAFGRAPSERLKPPVAGAPPCSRPEFDGEAKDRSRRRGVHGRPAREDDRRKRPRHARCGGRSVRGGGLHVGRLLRRLLRGERLRPRSPIRHRRLRRCDSRSASPGHRLRSARSRQAGSRREADGPQPRRRPGDGGGRTERRRPAPRRPYPEVRSALRRGRRGRSGWPHRAANPCEFRALHHARRGPEARRHVEPLLLPRHPRHRRAAMDLGGRHQDGLFARVGQADAEPRRCVGGRDLHDLRDDGRPVGPASFRLDTALEHAHGHLGADGGHRHRGPDRSRRARPWTADPVEGPLELAGRTALARGRRPHHRRPVRGDTAFRSRRSHRRALRDQHRRGDARGGGQRRYPAQPRQRRGRGRRRLAELTRRAWHPPSSPGRNASSTSRL